MVAPAVSHYIPEIFDAPQQYNPDRFAPLKQTLSKLGIVAKGFEGNLPVYYHRTSDRNNEPVLLHLK